MQSADDSDITPVQPRQPVRIEANTPPRQAPAAIPQPITEARHIPVPDEPAPPPADWIAIGLGIAAVILMLGLIPLWFAVYQAWAG